MVITKKVKGKTRVLFYGPAGLTTTQTSLSVARRELKKLFPRAGSRGYIRKTGRGPWYSIFVRSGK